MAQSPRTRIAGVPRSVRVALVGTGALLAIAALVAVLVPIRRVESIAEVRVMPTAKSAASAQLELQRRVTTSKALPDGLVAAAFTGGLAFIVLGVLLADVEELSFAGTKIKLAREVASVAVEQAQSEGLVAGESVPIGVVEQIAEQAAVAAVQAEELLSRRSGTKTPGTKSQGYIPPNVLRQLAKDAVQASGDVPPDESPPPA